MGVGPGQLAIIVLLLLLIFGASRLGEIGRGLGEGVRAFRKRVDGSERSDDEAEAEEAEEEDGDDDDEPERLDRPRREPTVQNKRHVMAKRRKRAKDDDERS